MQLSPLYPPRRGLRLAMNAIWRFGVVVAAVGYASSGTACGTTPAPVRTVQHASPPEPRAPTRYADTADHLVVLRAPHDTDRALDTVFAFFDAVRRESRDDLLESLTADAVFRSRSGHDPSLLARVAWNQRFARLSYEELDASSVFRPADIRTYLWDGLPEMAEWASPGPDDLWVVVPIRTRAQGGVRLFGRTITLLLHPTDRGYKIAAQVEDFQLP